MNIIAHITDVHIDEQLPIDQHVNTRQNWITILENIRSKGIKQIVFGGDIGEREAYKYFFDSLKDFDLFITPGNHDDSSNICAFFSKNILNNQFELYHSHEDKSYKYIYLDSSTELISDHQFEWFINELITKKKIVLFIHHPIVAIDTEIDKKYYLIGRDKIKDSLLSILNEVFIFCGHYHLEHQITLDNITQFITPASSYQVENHPTEIKLNNNFFGYRIVKFCDNNIETSIIRFE